ncbi:YQGE family putative transporter [Paenibacillus castaneae]|uniref:MFS transporter n=1 Tax=Paenibacillus castaneae TaxID=474957 RepID=UPI000C9B614D|nr:MFS transporter [Paenibacillus castaneae]NIK78769.1 YQGE family putative transporter [Paenibacillus castaneae]
MNLQETTDTHVSVRTKLPKPAKMLLSVNGLNGLGMNLSSLFINVYWYKLTQDMSVTLLFTLVSYVAWLPAFALAGWFSKRFSRKSAIVIGTITQLAFYGVILFYGEQSAYWIPQLGVLYGVGAGFYWLGINVLTVKLTSPSIRDWFNGANGMIGSITGMLGPLLAGWTVSATPDRIGYPLVFGAAFLCFLLSMLASFQLPDETSREPFQVRSMLGILRQAKWRRLTFAFVALAFREGVLSAAIGLWVFVSTQNEGTTGQFAFLTTLLSVVSFYVVGRFAQEHHHRGLLAAGTVLFSLSMVGISIHMNQSTLLLYWIMDSISRPIFDTPFNTLTYNYVSRFDLGGKISTELVVWREIALSVGRISSVGMLVMLYKWTDPALTLGLFLGLIFLVGLLPLLLVWKVAAASNSAASN